MTTVKKQKQNEAEAYLSISDPRTGLKPLAERMRFHDMNASDVPRTAPVGYSDDAKAAARALLVRAGIDISSDSALDHCLLHQDRPLSNAARLLGASVERYNGRTPRVRT